MYTDIDFISLEEIRDTTKLLLYCHPPPHHPPPPTSLLALSLILITRNKLSKIRGLIKFINGGGGGGYDLKIETNFVIADIIVEWHNQC